MKKKIVPPSSGEKSALTNVRSNNVWLLAEIEGNDWTWLLSVGQVEW